MELEEIKQRLKDAFGKYEFVSDGHYYLYDGQRVGISTTGLIHQYANEFDSKKVSQFVAEKTKRIKDDIFNNPLSSIEDIKYAIEQERTQEEVLEEWNIGNVHSTTKGSIAHEYAQSLWENKKFDIFNFSKIDPRIDKQKLKEDLINEKIQADKYYNDFKDRYKVLAIELYIGHPDYDECGAADIIFWDTVDKCIVLADFKTNKEIKYEGYKNQKMKVPLQEYQDCNFIHYSLQLSLYKFKLEDRTGLKIGRKELIYFDSNKTDYEIITPLDLDVEAKQTLENRRETEMKSIPILLYGRSGTGKTASLRNYKNEDIAYINILDKPLPFKSDIKMNSFDNYETIIAAINKTKKKFIYIDDAGFLMTNELFEKVNQTGYKKFTEIAEKFNKLINEIKKVDGGKIVVITMHEDKDDEVIKIKTAGKMVESSGIIEGNFTIALRSVCNNGVYQFATKNSGNDITKTPMGMFEETYIDNDFKLVEKAVREYYDLDKEEEKKEEEK